MSRSAIREKTAGKTQWVDKIPCTSWQTHYFCGKMAGKNFTHIRFHLYHMPHVSRIRLQHSLLGNGAPFKLRPEGIETGRGAAAVAGSVAEERRRRGHWRQGSITCQTSERKLVNIREKTCQKKKFRLTIPPPPFFFRVLPHIRSLFSRKIQKKKTFNPKGSFLATSLPCVSNPGYISKADAVLGRNLIFCREASLWTVGRRNKSCRRRR